MILITGANGFLGRKLTSKLANTEHRFLAATRGINAGIPNNVQVGIINGKTDWSNVLTGVDTVIHCAARAHKVDNESKQAQNDFISTNVDGTKKLIEDSIKFGVKRFIFISSIKVMGKQSSGDSPYTEASSGLPTDYYGQSKLEAEKAVKKAVNYSNINYTILRPCLMYGEGAKANLNLLNKALRRLPCFPTFSNTNRRSLTNVEDLLNIICEIVNSPTKYQNETYFVADNEPYSTKDLCLRLRDSIDTNCYLFNFLNTPIRFVLKAFGFSHLIEKLYGDMCVDVNKVRRDFGLDLSKRFK